MTEFSVHRGGEVYEEYCARAAAAGCEPSPFRNWVALAEVDDEGVWRTKHGSKATDDDRFGEMWLTARSFTAHCGRCGRAWSCPVEIPDFDAQQRQLLDWFAAHACEMPAPMIVVKGVLSEEDREHFEAAFKKASGGKTELLFQHPDIDLEWSYVGPSRSWSTIDRPMRDPSEFDPHEGRWRRAWREFRRTLTDPE